MPEGYQTELRPGCHPSHFRHTYLGEAATVINLKGFTEASVWRITHARRRVCFPELILFMLIAYICIWRTKEKLHSKCSAMRYFNASVVQSYDRM